MLKIANHGGKCCGVKTIHGFYASPRHIEEPLRTKATIDKDQNGDDVTSRQNFFSGGAPAETSLERLDRYISFIRTQRPQGLIEVTLASCLIYSMGVSHPQDEMWGELLEERGFKRVAYFRNSNSGNFVSIYHFDYATNPNAGKELTTTTSRQDVFPTHQPFTLSPLTFGRY